ncbi:MAG: trypsin-like peptidase domain-containing protein [Planctomycetota bacterium]|nr:trypsin-like peptidase domain-containing protein [Planctomycetota bacterium]
MTCFRTWPCLLLCATLGVFGHAATPREEASLDFRAIVNKAKDKVFPAVVFIRCINENYERGEKASNSSAGSGVLISEKGEVLTNWHVIDKAIEVRCLLFDGQAIEAKVVGSDQDTDLALLQLKLPDNAPSLPLATIGDSSVLKEGDFVMAMGAPWGLSRSVSIGIISCSQRFLENSSEYSLWLQTDAAISPGNSGGPLVNTDGHVIGLNARGSLMGGDMGFAIPSQTIQIIVPQLREFHRVNWSFTGLHLQPLRDFNRNIYFEGTHGVIVSDTDADSPARTAGILPRDRIVKINGQSATAITEEQLPALRRSLSLLPKLKPATIELERNGKLLSVQLTPREKGKVQGEELSCPRWDFTVKTINEFDNPELYFHQKTGVFVFGIKYPGNASQSGLQARDILLKIDNKPIATPDDVKSIHQQSLKNLNDSHRLVLTVLRNGLMKQVVIDISRDYSKE